MSYKSFLIGFLMIWLVYWAYLFISLVVISNNLKVTTIKNVHINVAGAFGLVKHYYIKANTDKIQLEKKSSDTDREYGGLSLARLLFPKEAINKQGVVTIYTLSSTGNTITYFAAAAGADQASKFRLYIDIAAYLINKYIWLHLALFFLFISLDHIYAYIYKARDITAAVTAMDTHSIFATIQSCLMYFALIIIFI